MAFGVGAQFAAHRDVLRRYPRSWWRRLRDRLAAADTQSVWPWALERLWRHALTRPPMAHFYHKVPGWFAAHDLYRKMVAEAEDGAHFVEVGSWVGQSASFMAAEIANSNKRIRFDAVDHFRGSSAPQEAPMREEAKRNGGTVRGLFEQNTAPVSRWINVVESDSLSAADRYPDDSLDFVYIDAGHSEEEVTADIKASRVRALLRRTQPERVPVLKFADLTLDTGSRQASRGNRSISLTAKEYELLELFLRHPKQVLTREVIFDRVWGYDFGGESNVIEVYVRYLRSKLEASGKPRLIHTIRGVGYVLRE